MIEGLIDKDLYPGLFEILKDIDRVTLIELENFISDKDRYEIGYEDGLESGYEQGHEERLETVYEQGNEEVYER